MTELPAPVHGRRPDHAVGGVNDLISRHPVGTEGKDICVVRAETLGRGAGSRLEGRHVESRLAPSHGGVGNAPSVRAPCGGNRARSLGHDLSRAVAPPHDDGAATLVRGVGQRLAVGRPLRGELVGGSVRDPAHAAIGGAVGEVERPDVVVAGPVRGEGDRGAARGVRRLPLVVGPERVLHRIGAVGPDRPDVPAAVPERLEDDPAPVRRPLRLPRVVVHVRDRARLAAPGVHHPERALEVEHHPAAVGGDGRGHVRALGHGDADIAILGIRRRGRRYGQEKQRRQRGEGAERTTAAGHGYPGHGGHLHSLREGLDAPYGSPPPPWPQGSSARRQLSFATFTSWTIRPSRAITSH